MNVVWWGLRWPWQWRFYYVRRPEYGWAELMLGFVGVLWAIENSNPASSRQDSSSSTEGGE